eukprot:1886782-Rhodomonas_salina.2
MIGGGSLQLELTDTLHRVRGNFDGETRTASALAHGVLDRDAHEAEGEPQANGCETAVGSLPIGHSHFANSRSKLWNLDQGNIGKDITGLGSAVQMKFEALDSAVQVACCPSCVLPGPA